MRGKKTLWIVEDDPGAQFVYEEVLGLRYHIKCITSLRDLAAAVDVQERPDLIIADLRLPDGSFLDFLGSATGDTLSAVPFIVVTSVDDLDVLRLCLNEGALDYITKPFGKSTLIHKVETLIDWRPSDGATSVQDIKLDLINRRMCKGEGEAVSLTPRELQLMTLLVQSERQTATRQTLVSRVWTDVKVGTKTVDVHIFNLRRKLKQIGYEIHFLKPDSYRLAAIEPDMGIAETSLGDV